MNNLYPFPIHVANCDQLSILYSPKALEFRGHARLDAESVSDVFGAALGYSVAHPTEWDGLIVKDPFNMANGAVVVIAEGIDSLTLEVRTLRDPVTKLFIDTCVFFVCVL